MLAIIIELQTRTRECLKEGQKVAANNCLGNAQEVQEMRCGYRPCPGDFHHKYFFKNCPLTSWSICPKDTIRIGIFLTLTCVCVANCNTFIHVFHNVHSWLCMVCMECLDNLLSDMWRCGQHRAKQNNRCASQEWRPWLRGSSNRESNLQFRCRLSR